MSSRATYDPDAKFELEVSEVEYLRAPDVGGPPGPGAPTGSIWAGLIHSLALPCFGCPRSMPTELMVARARLRNDQVRGFRP